MAQQHSERQLLLALLAFQTNFIDRGQLLRAFDSWSQDKSRCIAGLLREQGAINDDERQLLEGLVARHVARFDDDVQKSLGHVGAVNSSVREELEKVVGTDLQASLRAVGKEADPYATVAHAVGESTSDGTRFRILRPHARGGLGEVFVAQDGELPREVALKQIQSRHADDADSRARFVQEAEITGCLEHPNIVPVYGLGTYADGRPFYAMRFIRGDSLQDAVKRFHTLSTGDAPDRTLQFRKLLQRFIDVCNAIDYAHERGVLHRDLKPGNIMLGKYGETLVVDWGLAKPVGRQANEQLASEERPLRPSGASGSVETAYGSAIGTPAYMSPEQAAGRLDDLGPASDVYSLGATLYELLTGRPPLEGSDLGEILGRVRSGDIPKPRSRRPEVPPALEAICLKAMAVRPIDRYATARELADDLERWLADEPVAAYQESWTERVWNLLSRSREDVGFRDCGNMLLLFAAVVLAMKATVFWIARNGPPYSPDIRLAAGTVQGLGLAALAVAFAWTRRGRLAPQNGAERLMWSTWLGFLLASFGTLVIARLRNGSWDAVDDRQTYADQALLSGQAFLVMGSLYWGRCYLIAIGFFALALLIPTIVYWAILAFGIAWAAALTAIGIHLRRGIT
jgi:serine/threonine-protein kinase